MVGYIKQTLKCLIIKLTSDLKDMT